MLILTRKTRQSIFIGKQGEIRVTVMEINEDTVRLGVRAPEGMTVNERNEIVNIPKTMYCGQCGMDLMFEEGKWVHSLAMSHNPIPKPLRFSYSSA